MGALRGLQLEGGRDGTWELAREGGGETEREREKERGEKREGARVSADVPCACT